MTGGSVIGIGLVVVHVLLLGGVGYVLLELRKTTRPEPAVDAEKAAEAEATLR